MLLIPPSADDLPGRKPPGRQRRAAGRAEGKKRRRGKQPGSPGAAMRWEEPDRTEDHYPEGACACGRDLADAADPGVFTGPAAGNGTDAGLLARSCWVLALITEAYRGGPMVAAVGPLGRFHPACAIVSRRLAA